MDKLFAFWRRDWELAATTPLSFAYEIGQTIAGLLSFYFIAKITTLDDYFGFVLCGMIGAWVMSTGLSAVQETVHFERAQGTLEAILLTRTPLTTLLLGRLASQFFHLSIKIVVCLFIGHYLLGVRWTHPQWGVAAAALALLLFLFLGGGLVLTAASLIYRDTGPLEGLLSWTLRFFGGVYFPARLLPLSVGWIARWNPLTHGLDLMRGALGGVAAIPEVTSTFTGLSALAAVSLTAGIFLFRGALAHARQNGRLSFPP